MLIKIAVVLDPRYKLTLLNFTFKAIYSQEETADKVQEVKDTLDDMYKEYVEAHKTTNVGLSSRTAGVTESTTSKSGSSFPTSRFGKGIKTKMANYDQHIRSSEAFLSDTSELSTYLDEGVYIGRPGESFNVLGWWKEKSTKYRILSTMASDILAIPVTTIASESAFSAGGRVIDPHRASLGTEMVEMLICGSDWYHHYYGLHKKKNKESDIIIIEFP